MPVLFVIVVFTILFVIISYRTVSLCMVSQEALNLKAETHNKDRLPTFVSVSAPWAGRQESKSRPNTSIFADLVREQIRLQQEAAAAAAPPPFPGVRGLRITLTGVRVTSYSPTEPECQTRKGCSSSALRKLDSHISIFPPQRQSHTPLADSPPYSVLFLSSISNIVFGVTTALRCWRFRSKSEGWKKVRNAYAGCLPSSA